MLALALAALLQTTPPPVAPEAAPPPAATPEESATATEEAPAPAVQPAPVPEAPAQDPRLTQAITRFQLAELAEAEAALAALVEEPGLSAADRAAAWMFLSATHFAQQKSSKAKEDLARLYQLDPAARLDPLRFDPALVALQADLVKEATAPAEPAGPALAAKTAPETDPEPPPAALPVASAPQVSRTPAGGTPRWVSLASMVGGAAAIGVGAWGLGGVHARYQVWQDTPEGAPLPYSRDRARSDRTVVQPLSWVAIAAGGGLAGFGAWTFFARDEVGQEVTVGVLPHAGGGAAFVEGRF